MITSDLIIIAMIVGGVILIGVMLLSIWRKVPQDQAAVITGFKKRVISGGGGIVLPLLERIDYISLGASSLEVITEESMSSQNVPIGVVSTVVIKVKNEEESILKAIERFTGKNEVDITRNTERITNQILEGKLREVVSTMSVEELYRDREAFANQVQNAATAELAEMGLEVISFTIKDVNDKNGYIEALGVKQIVETKKEADIARARADKERQIETSAAKRDGQQASLQAETDIREAEKKKLLSEQAYKLEIETSRAESDAAYEIQEMVINKKKITAKAEAELLAEEKKKSIETTKVEIEIEKENKYRELEQAKAETAKAGLRATVVEPAIAEKEKQATIAEAEKFKQIMQAEASAEAKKRGAEAEAESIRLRAEAEAESMKKKGQAEAQAFQAKALAEAEGIKAKSLAEAEGIKAKALAEAQGMEKKADAYAKYNQAAVTEMIVKILPELAGKIAEPLTQIDKITVIDSGSGESGVSSLSGNVGAIMAKTFEAVKETTGFDMKSAMEADVEGKTTRKIQLSTDSQEVKDLAQKLADQ